jgi:hypothetical protein
MIELGAKVKDKVTGFVGIATGHTRLLTGCDRYLVQPAVGKDGKLPDECWFDENRLVVLKVPSQTGIRRERPKADLPSVG